MYDDRICEGLALYLAGSLAAFRCGTLQLFQVLFAGSQCQPIFWTRAPLYAQQAPAVEAAEWTPATS